MSPRRHILSIVIALSALGASTACAQLRLGIIAGYEFGYPLDFRRDNSSPWCDCGGTGSSESHTSRVGLRVGDLGFLFGRFGLSLQAVGSWTQGNFFSDIYEGGPVITPDYPEPVVPKYQFELHSQAVAAHLELLAHVKLSGRWSLGIGGWGKYRASFSGSRTFRIVSPENMQFQTGGREQTATLDDTMAADKYDGGVMASTELSFPLSSSLSLSTSIYGRVSMPQYFEAFDWKPYSIGATLGIEFDLESSTPADEPPVEHARLEPTPPPPLPSGSLELYGLDAANRRTSYAVVRRYGVAHSQTMPMPMTIVYEPGQSVTSYAYSRLDRAAAERFTLDSLDRMTPADIANALPDILGYRLRTDRRARVKLIGSTAPNEPSSLASARAEGIRDYLVSVWGIDESRVSIGVEKERRGSRLRVESDAPSITAPVETSWRMEQFTSPSIGVKPAFGAGVAVRRWTITIRHDSAIVARYVDGKAIDMPTDELSISLRGARTGAVSPLVAEMDIEDSLGRHAVAHATLPLQLEGGASSDAVELFVQRWVMTSDVETSKLAEKIAAWEVAAGRIGLQSVGGGECRSAERAAEVFRRNVPAAEVTTTAIDDASSLRQIMPCATVVEVTSGQW